jgi:hypothetical protein
MKINAQYNIAEPESIHIKIAAHQRRKMFKRFITDTGIRQDDTVLDVGVTCDQSYSHSNYLELWYPYKQCITACGLDDATFLEEMYAGLKFVRADGRNLPFANREFDYVHSSAVLEHVGSRKEQRAFLREALRVARKGVFITTPNRWFPIEFHTIMPFAHWLPENTFRKICRMRGLDIFASEDHLNLLSSSDLRQLAEEAGMENFKIACLTLAGWPSNLLLSTRETVFGEDLH